MYRYKIYRYVEDIYIDRYVDIDAYIIYLYV